MSNCEHHYTTKEYDEYTIRKNYINDKLHSVVYYDKKTGKIHRNGGPAKTEYYTTTTSKKRIFTEVYCQNDIIYNPNGAAYIKYNNDINNSVNQEIFCNELGEKIKVNKYERGRISEQLFYEKDELHSISGPAHIKYNPFYKKEYYINGINITSDYQEFYEACEDNSVENYIEVKFTYLPKRVIDKLFKRISIIINILYCEGLILKEEKDSWLDVIDSIIVLNKLEDYS